MSSAWLVPDELRETPHPVGDSWHVLPPPGAVVWFDNFGSSPHLSLAPRPTDVAMGRRPTPPPRSSESSTTSSSFTGKGKMWFRRLYKSRLMRKIDDVKMATKKGSAAWWSEFSSMGGRDPSDLASLRESRLQQDDASPWHD